MLDTKVVAEAWAKEFARLRKIIWVRKDQIQSMQQEVNGTDDTKTNSDTKNDDANSKKEA